jgi:hypothetical protein
VGRGRGAAGGPGVGSKLTPAKMVAGQRALYDQSVAAGTELGQCVGSDGHEVFPTKVGKDYVGWSVEQIKDAPMIQHTHPMQGNYCQTFSTADIALQLVGRNPIQAVATKGGVYTWKNTPDSRDVMLSMLGATEKTSVKSLKYALDGILLNSGRGVSADKTGKPDPKGGYRTFTTEDIHSEWQRLAKRVGAAYTFKPWR